MGRVAAGHHSFFSAFAATSPHGFNLMPTIISHKLAKIENNRPGGGYPSTAGAWLEHNMDHSSVINPATVLLVEDEALISEMISDALLEYGFQVHAVGNAGDALRYLRTGSRVDVLFTDINLPGDMDGTVLAEHARTMRPDLPIVFASGRWHLLENLRAVPRTACLAKPYNPVHACSVVEELVATRH
jgi:CheY-like chemotaxis protein